MYQIFGIKNCSTMKKALTALDDKEISYEFFDYKKQTISAEVITGWVEKLGIAVVLNKRGTTWRKQPDDVKIAAEADVAVAIELMAQNPSMIKRPILVNTEKKILMAGFDVERYNELN